MVSLIFVGALAMTVHRSPLSGAPVSASHAVICGVPGTGLIEGGENRQPAIATIPAAGCHD